MNIFVLFMFLVSIEKAYSTGRSLLQVSENNSTSSPNVLNISCGLSCLRMQEIGPPPSLILTMPPPPIPTSLNINEIKERTSSVGGECNFCVWASSNAYNGPTTKEAGVREMSWIIVLTVVATLSAVMGAIFIITILKCKNFKIFPVSEACPILGGSTASKDVPKDMDKTMPQHKEREEKNKPLVHMWSHTSSQEKPLQTPSSQCSEANSYTGEPYRNVIDTQPVYSEINISETSSTIYSELADQSVPPPLPPVGPGSKLLSDGAYENAAYLTSESLAGLPIPFQAGIQPQHIPKLKKPRSQPVAKPEKTSTDVKEASRQESPYYYKQGDHVLPARKPLPPLPSQRTRTFPRRPLPNTPPRPAMV